MEIAAATQGAVVSERSGLSDLDVALLDAMVDLGAFADRPHGKSARVLDELYRTTGIAPRYGYEVMCNLAVPWLVNVPVLDPHGNFGSPDFGPSNPRYTEVRLSDVGMLAVEAERGGPPVPIGMINGDIHVEGSRPPFDAVRVIDALTLAAQRPTVSDEELRHVLGPPSFPTGCGVDGDIDELLIAEPCRLTLRARMTREAVRGRNVIVVSALPPMASNSDIAATIESRTGERPWHRDHSELAAATRLPVADVNDESHDQESRLAITLKPEADVVAVEAQLRELWGIAITVTAQLRAPAAALLRGWVANCADDPLIGLNRLRAVVS